VTIEIQWINFNFFRHQLTDSILLLIVYLALHNSGNWLTLY